jgi:hypothetical protein
MQKRYLSGEEIRKKYGCTPKEIFGGVKSGALTPITIDGTQRVIDMRIHATLRPFSDDTFDPEFKNHCTHTTFDLNNILGYIYKAKEVEAFLKELFPAYKQTLVMPDIEAVKPSSNLENKMKEARVKGGRASKKNMAILGAAKQYILLKSTRIKEPVITIAKSFNRAYNSSTPCEIKIDSNVYEIYCDGNKICSTCNTEKRNKYHDKSISLSTFAAKYIPEAKRELNSSKMNNME